MKTTLAEKQAARRQRVIRAAMELATEGGYENVQMRDVAARAGVALGTLYRYFVSKDQLLAAALQEWIDELGSNLGRRPARGDSAADRVVDVLRRAVRSIERSPKLAAALIRAGTSPDRDPEGAPGRSMNPILSAVIGEDGSTDREAVIRTLDLVWHALVVQWMSGRCTTERMGDELETAARLLIR